MESHHAGGAWFVNQDCWWNDRLARAEESVETAHSAVNRLVFSKATETVGSLVATVEEFLKMMSTLQGQQHALNQEISRLTAENQQFRNADPPGLAVSKTAVGLSNANPRQN